MIYDKRKLKRYDIFLIVEFKPLRSPGGFSVGITRDLSPEGFSLESQTIECQRGDIMEFRLKHPDAEWGVDIPGEVIWRNHSWYKYIIGIKFLNVSEEQKTKIHKLMSAVRDEANKPELISKDSENLPLTREEKYHEAPLSAGVINKTGPGPSAGKTSHISLRGVEHCELTGKERTFITRDACGISITDGIDEIKPERDKEFNPNAMQMPVDNKTADLTAPTGIIEEDAEHEKMSPVDLNTNFRRETARAPYRGNIIQAKNNRKKKLWLYMPFVMVIMIILAIALPRMIEKFNHQATDLMPVLTESTDNTSIEKDKDIPSSDNVQISSTVLKEPLKPSPIKPTETKGTVPVEKVNPVNLRQASAGDRSTGILPPKSIDIAAVKSTKKEDTVPLEEIEKPIKLKPQLNNGNFVKSETSAAIKPSGDTVEKTKKIDLIANIDTTLKALQAIRNEKPKETEAIIQTEITSKGDPLIKMEKPSADSQPVKPGETPSAAAITKAEKIPEVKPEIKASEEEKETIKNPEQSVRRPELPNVVLLVKRDKSRTNMNNSQVNQSATASDLLKKWKPIGSTKSGVPLFIAPDTISYPHEHVVNLLVKASVDKKDFVDLLAINCSQIKLRILEEHNGNNPVFSSYSHEWKDIVPDSMILYNSACPEKK